MCAATPTVISVIGFRLGNTGSCEKNGNPVNSSVILQIWSFPSFCLLLLLFIVFQLLFSAVFSGFIIGFRSREQMEYAYSVLPQTRMDPNILMFTEILRVMIKKLQSEMVMSRKVLWETKNV